MLPDGVKVVGMLAPANGLPLPIQRCVCRLLSNWMLKVSTQKPSPPDTPFREIAVTCLKV